MTTMKPEDLIDLGFNKNEAKVYLALVRFGKASASQLTKDTKFHKNIVYDNLGKLADKGLVTYAVEESRKVFKSASPNMLIELFEEKERSIQEKKDKAKGIAKEISKISKAIKHKQEATIYRGVRGVRSFYNETLQGGDYVVFGAPRVSLGIMGETFWYNYNLKRKENKIRVRMIFNPSLKDFGESIKNRFTMVRYFEKDFEPLTETHIQKDKVGVIVWTEEPILFLIRDKFVAETYMAYFENMWDHSKR